MKSKKEKQYPCTIQGCSATFNTRFSLKRHAKKHSGDRPYSCSHVVAATQKVCGRKFAETSTLKRHMRTHTGERPYTCPFPGCGKSFADRTNVRRHRQTHVNSKSYVCPADNCERTFVRRGFLAKHISAQHKSMSAHLGMLAGASSGDEDDHHDSNIDASGSAALPAIATIPASTSPPKQN